MSLRERLTELIQACFTGLWIETHEPDEALSELAQLCQGENWRYATWNIDTGLRVPGAESAAAGQDPLAAIRALNSMADSQGTMLLVLQNMHRFLGSAEIVQALIQQIHQGKQQRTFVVVLAPVVNIPVELEKLFVVVEHELPNREQLAEIARQIATEPSELPTGRDWETVLDAAAGLTRYEAEGAFSLSLVRHDRLQAEAVWSIKEGLLKKSGLLQLYRGQESFDSLGGLHSLKAFCRRALLQSSRLASRPRPRGLLLVSPPGCGKSQFCKTLGNETGRPVLQLDIGTLMGSLVGQSEERMRQALKIADAMAPCVLMIDEVEKALSGVSGSAGDGGVSSRLFGTLLTWLNDHTSDVFVVCTANDVSRLPPEFARAERFDGIFMLDLPGQAEKQTIWELYSRQYEVDQTQKRPADTDWTGAEIKSCCRLAALLDLPLVVMLLIGHVGHLPLPCYDGDGENRGTLTQGLTDPGAWHIFLLGVTPESDIDRGPFSSDHPDQLYVSAFGPAVVVNAKVNASSLDVLNGFELWLKDSLLSQAIGAVSLGVEDVVPRTYGCSYLAHTAQEWRNRLCLMLI